MDVFRFINSYEKHKIEFGEWLLLEERISL